MPTTPPACHTSIVDKERALAKLDRKSQRGTTMQVLALAISLVLKAAAPSLAEPGGDWLTIADFAEFRASINPRTYRRVGDHVTVWTKYEYPKFKVDVGGRRYDNAVSLWEFDCSARVGRVRMVRYHLGNRLVWSGQTQSNRPWSQLGSGSINESYFKLACG
jgi:hypothetical protein